MAEKPDHSAGGEAVDMDAAERCIRRSGLLALAVTLLAAFAAYHLLPLLWSFPQELPARLAFAAQASAFVLVWVLVGVGIVSTLRRFSPEDIGGSAFGPPSPRLAVPVAFLQNTLEQAVLAAGMYLALASLLAGPWLALIVVGVVLFGVGRVLFLRGYARGVFGRAFGMTLTMMPTLLGYLLVIALVIGRII